MHTRSINDAFLRVFPSIMLPMFLAIADQTIIATALSDIGATLGSPEHITWVIVGYLVAATISAPISGTLGDVFGRRRIFFCALGFFSAACLLSTFAPTLEVLALARIVQGFGAGALASSSHAIIGEYVPPRERGRYQGYIAAVMVSAATFGPVAGGLLTENFGWRSIFVAELLLALVAIALVFRLPSGVTSRRASSLNLTILLLFVAAVLCFFVAVEEWRAHLGPSVTGLLWIGATFVGGALFLVAERCSDEPLVPRELTRVPAIWFGNAIAALHGATLVSFIVVLPLYLASVHRFNAGQTGLFLLPLTVGIGFGSLAVGRLVTRTGYTAIYPAISLAVSSAVFLALAVLLPNVPMGGMPVFLSVLGLGMGPTMAVVQLTVQVSVDSRFLGVGAGFVQFSRSIGGALGAAVMTTLFFGIITAHGGNALSEFQSLLAAATTTREVPEIQNGDLTITVERAMQFVFAALALFAASGSFLAWRLPVRRV